LTARPATKKTDPLATLMHQGAMAALDYGCGERYRDDPVRYARDAFGLELWSKQAEIGRALTVHDRAAAKSGHKIGKSTLAAALSYWWNETRPRGRVVMTSSSGRQVRSILWREVKRLRRTAKPGFSFPTPAELPDLGMQWEDGREIVGFSTDDPERMAGISGDQVLFIVDEASGVKAEIFDAIEGNTAGGGSILMLSNPTQTSGYFYDAFNRNKSEWKTFTISSEETPNVVQGRIVIPGLATREWVEKRRRGWGVDSPRYAVRVKGEFPAQGDDTVIPLGLVDEAQARWNIERGENGYVPSTGPLHMGVDVARFGDDESVLAPRRGYRLEPLVVFDNLDTTTLARKVVEECKKRSPYERVYVKVDGTGVGAGVVDSLREFGNDDMPADWMTVIEVNNAERADKPDEYLNRRAEIAFDVRRWLESGGAIPEDLELEGELVATKYRLTPKNQIQIESKDEIRRRLGRSPDRADGFGLAVFDPGVESYGSNDDWVASGDSRWDGMGRGF